MSPHSGPIPPFFSKRELTEEGSLISGINPTSFTTTDPLRLWTVQVGVIIITAQLLHIGLRRMRQPKVVAEILGGIILGPTALGRIPGFTERIFPPESLPYLSLTADIGLCLFLFLVGMEIDTSIIRRNARMSAIVTLAGIGLPFGLGSALSAILYHRFIDPSVHFTYFMLFTGVAYSITAFPILCRVLTELKLLNTHVGIVVLSAGVGNDVVGWILLALGVTLVNASSGLTALWILLVCVSFAIFLFVPVKFALRWLAHKTGSIENGPSVLFMTVILILVWACGFFTDSIGVNAILGAFLSGLIVPREGGLAITMAEKLEDIVSIIFLPIYFTMSGLNTNLGLLNDGITWGFTIAIVALSFSGKFGGCTIACKLAGYSWHESSMVGALMICKGLLELIVLNVGLQAGVLSQRVFSMFVIEAFTLTFTTTPLVTTIYSHERRAREGKNPPPSKGDEQGQSDETASILTEEQPWRHRFTVVLDKMDHVPGAMALTQLVLPPWSAPSDIVSALTITDKLKMPRVSVEALQLVELSNRTSAMMKSSAADSLIYTESMLGIFRMFGDLNELAVTKSLSVVPHDEFARSVAEHAQRHASHLVLLPWAPSMGGEAIDIPDGPVAIPKMTKGDQNPFDILFDTVPGTKADKLPMVVHSQFVRGVFSQSKTDVALFIDTGDRLGVRFGGSVHVFFPFFGGPDDRLALEFVVQLCLNPRITATVVRVMKQDGVVDEGVTLEEGPLARPPFAHLEHRSENSGRHSPRTEVPSVISMLGFPDTVYGQSTAQMGLQSETADRVAWSKYTSLPATKTDTQADIMNTYGLRQALSRIHFSESHTSAPVQAAIGHARSLQETSQRLLIVAGRSRRFAQESNRAETKHIMETSRSAVGPVTLEGMCKTIGDVGAAMAVTMGGSVSAVVVLQAAHVALD